MNPYPVLKKYGDSLSQSEPTFPPDTAVDVAQTSKSYIETVERQSTRLTSLFDPAHQLFVAGQPLRTSARSEHGSIIASQCLHQIGISGDRAELASSSTDLDAQPSEIDEMDPEDSSATINFDFASLWLRTCERHHEHKCDRREAGSQSSQIVNIILIDTKHNCLVEATTAMRFFALSYVWGSVPQFQTSSAIFAELKQDNGLLTYMHAIPQVIRDAMEVVRGMGENYLWVDSLCIIQDDAEAKHNQISHMAAIYSGAVVTIIAVSARNAHGSLPGVRSGTRWPRS
jgi:hypothetical protein